MKTKFLLGFVAIIIAILYGSVFVIDKREKALVIFLGKVVREIDEPGLYFKAPFFLNEVVRFDNRILDIDVEIKSSGGQDSTGVFTADEKKLNVDAFVKYRITDPSDFYIAVQTEENAGNLLRPILESSIKSVMQQYELRTILNGDKIIKSEDGAKADGADGADGATKQAETKLTGLRAKMMQQITAEVNRKIKDKEPKGQENAAGQSPSVQEGESELGGIVGSQDGSSASVDAGGNIQSDDIRADSENVRYGVEIIDVRIRRTDLPVQNAKKVYSLIISDREKEIQKIKSEGEKQYLRITSQADKQKIEIISNAKKQSQIIKGLGDAKATEIFANAFSSDKEFFQFYRSMQAYKKAFADEEILAEGEESTKGETSIILSPEGEFFQYFK